MKSAIGVKKAKINGVEKIVKVMTRIDHPMVSNQLATFYSDGKKNEAMKAVIGEEAMNQEQREMIKFLSSFERKFINQGIYENRKLEQSLDLAWTLLDEFKFD